MLDVLNGSILENFHGNSNPILENARSKRAD